MDLQGACNTVGWDNWGSASLTYFRLKWGSTGASGDDCAEVETAVPGVLRQQPFEGRQSTAQLHRQQPRRLKELP